MHELLTAFLHFDPPTPGTKVRVGPITLRGWLVAKPGRAYTDLRAVVGPDTFPGIYGFPRSDLADFFKANRPYLLAGFEIDLNLAAGRQQVVVEACAINGAWEPIETVDFNAEPDPATMAPVVAAPLRPTEFGEALRILLRQMHDPLLAPGAGAAAIVRATPRPHYLRHPHLPFHGHLDEPQAWARSIFGRVAVAGWIFHETASIKRVFATTDLQAVQNLRFGRESPFLAALYPGFAHVARNGFDGFVDLPAQLPQPVTVRVYAELADGSWHLGSVARIAVTDHEFAKQAYPPFSIRTLWRAWRALQHEFAACAHKVEAGLDYVKTVAGLGREYATQAPRIIAPGRPARRRLGEAQPRGRLGHIHCFTHNLSHEGAPLFLLEYARYLHHEAGATISVTSGREGPLRLEFETLGATVAVVDSTGLLEPANVGGLHRALQSLPVDAHLQKADLVVANTLSAYWGVHLAHRSGRPVLYYIHESTSPRGFFRGLMPPAALATVEESFRLADRVSFLTGSSQRYFAALSDQSNYCLNPGWIDLARVDGFRAAHARDELRSELGIAPATRLVINVGTVCDRKGQHIFARAVDLLWRLAPELAASAEFLMVGGRDTSYDRALAEFLLELRRPNLRVVPETADTYSYYGAADLFVCSSYEESFPRVVLEAMAFSVPIVSSDVHGIPEMVRLEQEALLVPPGDSAALAGAMQRLLGSPETGRRLAERSRKRVAAEFDSRLILPRHAALARELAGAPP